MQNRTSQAIHKSELWNFNIFDNVCRDDGEAVLSIKLNCFPTVSLTKQNSLEKVNA